MIAHLGTKGPVRFILPDGGYVLEIRADSLFKRVPMSVTAGERSKSLIPLDAGEIELRARHSPNGPDVGAYLAWTVFPAGPDAPGGGEAIAHFGKPGGARFLLSEGAHALRGWWHRFGPFLSEIKKPGAAGMKSSRWRWCLDGMFVKIEGERHCLWCAVDHEGEPTVRCLYPAPVFALV